MIKKQFTTFAVIFLCLTKAWGITEKQITDSNSETVADSAIDNEGITVFSDNFADTTTIFEDAVYDTSFQSDSYSKTFEFNLGPFSFTSSNNCNTKPPKFKDCFMAGFKEFKEMFKHRPDFPFFMNTSGFPIPISILGFTIFPMLIILIIIACSILLYILGKKAKEKELCKKSGTDNYECSQKSSEKIRSGNQNRTNSFNEQRNKGLAVIICGVLLLLLSIIFRLSWFIKIGALALIIIGLVNYMTSFSSNNSAKGRKDI